MLNRRLFPRLHAPVFASPAGLRARLSDPQRVVNISVSGIRMYTDEHVQVGEHLELEIFLPDKSSVKVVAKVVWMDVLPEDGPAKFELGAEFTRIDTRDALRLKDLLHD